MELRGGAWEKMASMVLGRLKSSGGRTGGGVRIGEFGEKKARTRIASRPALCCCSM
jgi:hypothetical protein